MWVGAALTLAHSVSLSGGQLMGERTSTAPRGVLPQWWRVHSAIQDAPGCRAEWGRVACSQMDATAPAMGAAQGLATLKTLSVPSLGLGAQQALLLVSQGTQGDR